jgi:hypothetical protein
VMDVSPGDAKVLLYLRGGEGEGVHHQVTSA